MISLSAFTSSWTGLDVAGITVGDGALIAATAFSALSWINGERRISLRPWMFLPPAGALLVGAIGVLLRQDTISGFDYVVRIAFGTTLIAILISSERATRGASGLMNVLRWWAFGVVVNAAVAFLSNSGLINFEDFVNNESGTLRAIGLAFHPNSLAFSISIALPTLILFWSRLGEGWFARFVWFAGFIFCLNALYLADSRAGLLVGAAAGLIGLFIALSGTWARLFSLPVVGLVCLIMFHYAPPLLATTRFADGAGAESNRLRISYNAVALDTFAVHPVFGGGLGSMTGVSIPLQLLSGGGIVLLALYTIFLVVPSLQFVSSPRGVLSYYGLLSVVSIVGFGLLNSALTERVTYWAPLIMASIIMINRDRSKVTRRLPGPVSMSAYPNHK